MFERSYLSKKFTIASPDARLRRADDLMAFDTSSGAIMKIPQGTVIRVDDVQRLPTGAKKIALFAHAIREDGTAIGWTSTGNLEGKFVNETLELLLPAAGSGKFGPNAAWSHGVYAGQLDLVEIVDAKIEIERLAMQTVSPYLNMVSKAGLSGVIVAINSGFRSYPEQKFLWDGFSKHLPNFNQAAKPGFSNHQNGIAFDIDIVETNGNEVYDWLKKHAPSLGFLRTVNNEPWHWEYDPHQAQQAAQKGTYKLPSVTK